MIRSAVCYYYSVVCCLSQIHTMQRLTPVTTKSIQPIQALAAHFQKMQYVSWNKGPVVIHCGWYRCETPYLGLCQMISTLTTQSRVHHGIVDKASTHFLMKITIASTIFIQVILSLITRNTLPLLFYSYPGHHHNLRQPSYLHPYKHRIYPNNKCQLPFLQDLQSSLSIKVCVSIQMSAVADTSLNLGWIRRAIMFVLPSECPSDPLQQLHMTGASFSSSISSLLVQRKWQSWQC